MPLVMPRPQMPLSLRYTSVVSLFGLLSALNSCRHYPAEVSPGNSDSKHAMVFSNVLRHVFYLETSVLHGIRVSYRNMSRLFECYCAVGWMLLVGTDQYAYRTGKMLADKCGNGANFGCEYRFLKWNKMGLRLLPSKHYAAVSNEMGDGKR